MMAAYNGTPTDLLPSLKKVVELPVKLIAWGLDRSNIHARTLRPALVSITALRSLIS